MKKYILYFTFCIIIVFLVWSINNDITKVEDIKDEQVESLIDVPNVDKNLVEEVRETTFATSTHTVNKNMSVPDQAWVTLRNYLVAAKAHDLITIKNLAHRLSFACANATSDSKQEAQCFSNLDKVYQVVTDLKKEDFKNAWFDSKQLILFSESNITRNETRKTATKVMIYFIIDNSGNIKFLSIDSGRAMSINVQGLTEEQIDSRLDERTKDNDQDGVEDVVETCSVQTLTKKCVKTDPQNRDSNGDGYWDGIDELLNA